MRTSSLYQTKPRDFIEQADFYNMAVTGTYAGSPRELLEKIHGLEERFGRDRLHGIPKGPRTLDIDIELFGDDIIREADLVIPHERMNERQFVLVPLLELLPDSIDPVSLVRFADIAARLPDQGVKEVGNLYGN